MRRIEQRKATYAFGARAYANEYVVTSFDSLVGGTRLPLREVEDIRLFVVLVGNHIYTVSFLIFFARYAVRMNGRFPIFTTIARNRLRFGKKR